MRRVSAILTAVYCAQGGLPGPARAPPPRLHVSFRNGALQHLACTSRVARLNEPGGNQRPSHMADPGDQKRRVVGR